MILNLGCGDDHHEDAVNVDNIESVNPDQLVDLDSVPWPWDDDSVDTIRAYHVFEHLDDVDAALRESERILRRNGTLVVKWPVAMNQLSDDTHKHMWTWKTPVNKTKNHWDSGVNLRVDRRDVTLWSWAPGILLKLQWAKFRLFKRLWGPGAWCWRPPGPTFGPFGGEFTVVFRRE